MGFVKITFDPSNRPGKFTKSVVVDFGKGFEPWLLVVSGNVVQKDLGPEDFYPFEDGNLRFRTNHIAFGDVIMGQSDTASTLIFNQGKEVVWLDTQHTALPPYLQMHISRNFIRPGGYARAKFRYRTREKKEYGYVKEFLFLVTDDSLNPRKRIDYTIDIKEDFSSMSRADIAAGPRVSFDKKVHDFGELKQNDRVFAKYQMTNTGKSTLIIRKVKGSCGCTAAASGKESLEPGESTEIEIAFTTGARTGKIRKNITVITNDPTNPVAKLEFTARLPENKN